MYSDKDRDMIKVLKYNQDISKELNKQLDDSNARLSSRIAESEAILKQFGYNPKSSATVSKTKTSSPCPQIKPKTYEELLLEANSRYGNETEFGFEDILSSKEIADAYKRVDEINKEFSNKTRLGKIDLCFLILATALQTTKWILLPAIGETFNPEDRLSHNDSDIESEHKQTLNDFRDEHYSRDGASQSGEYWQTKEKGAPYKSWIEILFTKAPYDKITGSSGLGLGLNGANHRLKTLGHDPILGWIFGTANFMTDTATLSTFDSYRIRNAKWVDEPVPLPQLFSETIEVTKRDWHCLAAALVAQGAHLKSDEFTKMGLPVPFLTTLNEEWASKLYSEHYDALCAQRDLKTIAKSAMTSIFINMIVSFVHGMFYDPAKHGQNKELYEVKTRKILLVSNTLATGSNIIYAYITKNPHRLDIGGLLVTLSRLFLDIRFIARIKEEFIQSELDKDLNKSLEELDELEKEIIAAT